MGENKIQYRYIFYVIIFFGTVGLYTLKDRNLRKEISTDIVDKKVISPKGKVVKAYTDKIGWREKTGNNDGPQIEYILSTVGLKKGDQWCAAFVYACFYEAGVTGVPKSGYSPSWFPKEKTYFIRGTRGSPDNAQ